MYLSVLAAFLYIHNPVSPTQRLGYENEKNTPEP